MHIQTFIRLKIHHDFKYSINVSRYVVFVTCNMYVYEVE